MEMAGTDLLLSDAVKLIKLFLTSATLLNRICESFWLFGGMFVFFVCGIFGFLVEAFGFLVIFFLVEATAGC